MAKQFMNERGARAFKKAIVSIEACSSAEVMIAVRHHSGSYLHADALMGALAAVGTLAFALFSNVDFALLWIFLDPIAVGVVFGVFCTQLPWLRRGLTPRKLRRARVESAARCAFYEKGIRLTSGRTGMLVYLSLLERMVCVVTDRGVEEAVPSGPWNTAVQAIESTLTSRMDALMIAEKITALGAVCAPVLVHQNDDVNELPDEVSAP